MDVRGPRPLLPEEAKSIIKSQILEMNPEFPQDEFPLLFKGIENLARMLPFGSKPPKHWKIMSDKIRNFEQDEYWNSTSNKWVPAGFFPINPIPVKKRRLAQEVRSAKNASKILRGLLFDTENLSEIEKSKQIISANKWLRRAGEPQIPIQNRQIFEQELVAALNRAEGVIGIAEGELRNSRRASWYDPTLNRWLDGLANLWEAAGFQANQGAAFSRFCIAASGPMTKPTDFPISENTVREFIQRRGTWHMDYRNNALGEKSAR